MRNVKSVKFQATATTKSWEFDQEVKQQKRQHKQFRDQRKGRKGVWQAGE